MRHISRTIWHNCCDSSESGIWRQKWVWLWSVNVSNFVVNCWNDMFRRLAVMSRCLATTTAQKAEHCLPVYSGLITIECVAFPNCTKFNTALPRAPGNTHTKGEANEMNGSRDMQATFKKRQTESPRFLIRWKNIIIVLSKWDYADYSVCSEHVCECALYTSVLSALFGKRWSKISMLPNGFNLSSSGILHIHL